MCIRDSTYSGDTDTADFERYQSSGDAYDKLGYSPYRDNESCLLYTSPSPRDRTRSRMPSSA